MMVESVTNKIKIGASDKQQARLGFGGWSFGANQWTGQEDANLLGAMEHALYSGISHFDTASDYGDGYSEQLIGRFIGAQSERRDAVFVASKVNLDEVSVEAMLEAIDASRARMRVDMIDLYYIHWPRTGKDMRPWMEALETARQQGKIRAIGVSNFSVEQMEQISQVGKIDAHQLCYNLFWRFPERDTLPYCADHGIAVMTYASLAHGMLSGNYPRQLNLPEGDQRRGILLFRDDIWPTLSDVLDGMRGISERAGRPLLHLAIRWLLSRRGVTLTLVGARNAEQVTLNADALAGDILPSDLDALTALSDSAMVSIPDVGNPYGYYP